MTVLHGVLNLGWLSTEAKLRPDALAVGFLPVTCHLTCPVTHFINEELGGERWFEPARFTGFPEIKEAFLSGDLPATFILAPMAIALREQGVPIKIVYLGHRDGTALVVRKDSDIFRTEQLKGKTIAVPGRFANQRLVLHRELKARGLSLADVKVVELAPPDMPAALYARAVDAITSGEPFMGQTELDGYGRVLWQVKDVWPGFISCVLAVNEHAIANRRDVIQRLVDGIAKSGLWLDADPKNRLAAAERAGPRYYHQDPRLLRYVLSQPPDRVTYSSLTPARADFEEIERLGLETGMLRGTAHFDDYVDTSFSPAPGALLPWALEARP